MSVSNDFPSFLSCHIDQLSFGAGSVLEADRVIVFHFPQCPLVGARKADLFSGVRKGVDDAAHTGTIRNRQDVSSVIDGWIWPVNYG